jgi:hypothetical protein
MATLLKMFLAVRQRFWFQHDAARALCEENVRQWFNEMYIQEGGLGVGVRFYDLGCWN